MTTTADVPGLPVLPKVEMQLIRPASPAVGTVVRSVICTASRKAAGWVRHVEIDVSKTAMAGRFRPGQSFGVLPPGTDARGKAEKVRLYSIASPSRGESREGVADGGVVATTVKRLIDEHWDDHRLFVGRASNFLCDLQEGDEVRVTGPAGKRFLLPEDPGKHDYLFFATGTGIAPFRGMVTDLLERGVESRVVLVMGSPYATDLLYHDEFLKLAAEHANFTYLTAISRERQADVDAKLYVADRLETHRDALGPLLESERALVYLCGLAGMELGVFKAMAGSLPPALVRQYLKGEAEALAQPDGWTRETLKKQVRPTGRVFVEVY